MQTAGIQAFVGHSFTEDDAAVVGKFTKYFDSLSGPLGLNWFHAEPAEPKELTEKVLTLMGKANVFIAICTRKERVCGREAVRARWWGGSGHVLEHDLGWKTSDWVIQEVGAAKALGLKLILLIEKGVRGPGGLQGNVEYIEFPREAPEQAFGKVTEMLGAISSSPRPLSEPVPEEPPASGGEAPGQPEFVRAVPQPTWDREDYERELLRTLIMGDESDEEHVTSAFLASPFGRQPLEADRWVSLRENFRFMVGQQGSVPKLKEMADRHPEDTVLLRNLATAYSALGEGDEAARVCERAAATAAEKGDVIEQLRCLRAAARVYLDAGDAFGAVSVAERMRTLPVAPNGEAMTLEVVGWIAEKRGESPLRIATLERRLAADPGSSTERFAVAYAYSEAGDSATSLYHYLAVPENARSPEIWNNIGVARINEELPIRGVEAYRAAERSGNRRAMANLAQRLLEAGFLPEAKALCERARGDDSFDTFVLSVTKSIPEATEAEEKKERKLLEGAQQVSRFYRELGRGAATAPQLPLPTRWTGKQCPLILSESGMSVQITGTYEVHNALRSLFSAGSTPTADKHYITYKLVRHGRALVGTVLRESADARAKPQSILSQAKGDRILAVLSEDGTRIEMMEQADGQRATFASLVRAAD